MLQEQVPPREAGAFAMGCGLSKFLWPRALFACRQQSCPLLVLASLHANVLRTLGVYWRLFAKLLQTHCLWLELDVEGSYLFVRKMAARGANVFKTVFNKAWRGMKPCLHAMSLGQFTQETRLLAMITCTQFSDGVVRCSDMFLFVFFLFYIWAPLMSRVTKLLI